MSGHKTALSFEVQLTPLQLAESFAAMGDDDQAAFFLEVTRIAKAWGSMEMQGQWMRIGTRLHDTLAAEMVQDIADGAK